VRSLLHCICSLVLAVFRTSNFDHLSSDQDLILALPVRQVERIFRRELEPIQPLQCQGRMWLIVKLNKRQSSPRNANLFESLVLQSVNGRVRIDHFAKREDLFVAEATWYVPV
jgi:hypothetical protein